MATNSITSVHQGGMAFKADVKGHDVIIDLNEDNGGNDLGTSPKMLMLVSFAGCTGVDVVGILNKMKVNFSEFSINVYAHLTETDPKIYDDVTVTYAIKVRKKMKAKFKKQ